MSELLQTALHYISIFSIVDVIDILIVAYAVYKAMKLIHGTGVEAGIKGILFLIILLQVSDVCGLNVVNYILRNTLQLGFIAIIIMFQPELRKMLEQVGRSGITQIFDREAKPTDLHLMIKEIVDACSAMSWTRTGALIIFERKTKMDDIITAATILDAKATSELIRNVFFVKAPLHDGAMIISNGRILAAGCVLPLSEDETLSKELGTRHRAGIGITEVTDAISVIVSEETGTISVAQNGEIKRGFSAEALENLLINALVPKEDSKDVRKKVFSNISKWKGKMK